MKQILNPFRWMMPAMAAVLLVQCGSVPEAEEAQAPAARLTRVGVQAVNPGPFAHSFAVQGNVQTDRVANVLAAFPGVVREVLVEEGANVKEGTALVRIDTDVLTKQRAELVTQYE
jgi:multidrug efflux pump subunit AcrA (membrane-fusion protein)